MKGPAIFFMHLPKTGGMTVEKFLSERITPVGPWYYDGDFFAHPEHPGDFRLVRGHLPWFVSQVLPDNAFRIIWLRDPVARTLSAFKHFLRDRHHPLHEEVVQNASTVVQGFDIPEVRITLTNPMTRFLGADLDFASLVGDVQHGRRTAEDAGKIAAQARRREATEETLRRAKERLGSFDFIGFTERMEDDLVNLAGKLGMDPPDRAEKVNTAWAGQSLAPEGLSPKGRRVIEDATVLDRRLFAWAAEREGLSEDIKMTSRPVPEASTREGGKAAGEAGSKAPVFCTGLYRSGTSLLWNLLRQHEDVRAYYEPMHTNLRDRLDAGGEMRDTSHKGVRDYYSEYADVPAEVMDRHRRHFGVSRLCLAGSDEHAELQEYLAGFVESAAPGRAVMKLMRNDFRMPWLKARFPHAGIVHLNRNPRAVWASVARTVSEEERKNPWMNSGFDILLWAADAARVMPELFHDTVDSSYGRHYLLWRLADSLARRYADIVIDYESDLLARPEATLERIMATAGLDTAGLPSGVYGIIERRSDEEWKAFGDEVDFQGVEQACDRLFEHSGLPERIANGEIDSSWPDRFDELDYSTIQNVLNELSTEVSRVRGHIVDPDAAFREKDEYIASLESVVREKDLYISSLRENYSQVESINRQLNESLEESRRYADSLNRALESKEVDSREKERYIRSLRETLDAKEAHLSDIEFKLSALTEASPLLGRANRAYLKRVYNRDRNQQ